MTTPPLGVGYADGGVTQSLWGDPLLVYPPASTPSGTVLFSGYVGNWASVQLLLQSSSAAVLWQFAWSADAAGTVTTGVGDATTNVNGPIAAILLANQGPYLQITASTNAGTPATLAISVVPCAGVSQAPIGFTSAALSVQSIALAAGASAGVNVPTVRTGRATISIYSSGAIGATFIDATDYTNTSSRVGAVQNSQVLSGAVADVTVPPMPIQLISRNLGAAAGNFVSTLSFAPN